MGRMDHRDRTADGTFADRQQEHALPAALYLLACDANKGRLTRRDVMGNVIRAAALVELTERGCIADEQGKVCPAGDRRTGDPVLDSLLREMDGRRLRRWRTHVDRHPKDALRSVEERLEREQAIAVERRALLPDRVRVRDKEAVERLRAECAEVLTGPRPAAEYAPRQAALVALAAAARLNTVLPTGERFHHRRRIKELTERAGPAATALKKVLERKRAAASGAAAGGAAAAGGG